MWEWSGRDEGMHHLRREQAVVYRAQFEGEGSSTYREEWKRNSSWQPNIYTRYAKHHPLVRPDVRHMCTPNPDRNKTILRPQPLARRFRPECSEHMNDPVCHAVFNHYHSTLPQYTTAQSAATAIPVTPAVLVIPASRDNRDSPP